jgi:hypothetical protein
VQRISPIPGPTNPDPILQNLQAVMDNHYQLPVYLGGFPDYLSRIWLQTNTYTASPGRIAFNPCDDKIMNIQFGQNWVYDTTFTFVTGTIGTNTLATSFDGGLSWNYGPPVEQIIPLGGTISQIINFSLGPGLALQYVKNGRLYASGHGFMDMIANPPNTVPKTGYLFTHSDDNGKTWAAPKIVLSSDKNWWIIGGPFATTGLGPREFYTTFDPANNDIIQCTSTSAITNASVLWGNINYFHSQNGGDTFSPIKPVYRMIDDPVWKAEHFDPDFTSDPNYFIFGGLALNSAFPIIYDQNTLLLPAIRTYPKIGATEFFGVGDPARTAYDQAVVRSLDNGKTWCKVAGATDQFIYAGGLVDPGFLNPFANNFAGVFGDSTGQETHPVVSPFTGRVYFTYAAGNPASSPNPFVAQFYPYVLLSASSDKGETWTHAVQINRTPANLSRGHQIAFCSNAAMTHNGYYCVAYYDFRNWTGVPGEDVLTTPLQTDVWLDIYKEVDDPKGGSTGVGLDFVDEIRVTPQSFDARIASQSFTNDFVLPGTGNGAFYLTGTVEGLSVSVNNNNTLFVVFSMTGSRSQSNDTIGYKGMTISTNNLTNIFLQRYQFAKPSNQ